MALESQATMPLELSAFLLPTPSDARHGGEMVAHLRPNFQSKLAAGVLQETVAVELAAKSQSRMLRVELTVYGFGRDGLAVDVSLNAG